ncbi:ephrin-B2-like isoform X2 [Pocillopora verrucosa]|uniref:ephrin-B2-like isoform X2 n=1 Tax=Pocillopora verrucosa TaxID=203993 RepID=UPI00333E7CE1
MGIVSLIQRACIILSLLIDSGRSELYPSIQWTRHNPKFASNRTQCVHPMSKVIFVCPNTATIVKRLVHSSYVDPQYENLWLVRKQSYERCVINTTTDTRLWLCDEPLKLKYYTVTFKRFSASKEPEFQPGKDYYIIATSDGRKESLNSTSGGNCRTNRMKLKFYVCTSNADPRCKSEDECNRVSPTQSEFTSSDPTSPTKTVESHSTLNSSQPTSRTKTVESHATLNSNISCVNNTHPTIRIINPDDPEKEKDVLSSTSGYEISIGFLGVMIFLLLVLSTILMYKLHLKRKVPASSSRSSALLMNETKTKAVMAAQMETRNTVHSSV